MGKIRVQDLAKMMNLPSQDLIFKLKSIGVRVEGDDAHIDTDTLQAILKGKQLPHPREVILRDEEAQASAPKPSRRGPRRQPASPLRPNRPRTVIRKVDSRIESLPSKAKPEPAKEEPPQKTPEQIAQEEAAKQAAVEAAKAAPVAEKEVAEAPAAEEAKAAPKPTKAAQKKAPEKKVAKAEPAAAEETEEAAPKRAKGKAKPKKKRLPASDEDLAAYRGKIEDIEAVEEEEQAVEEIAEGPARADLSRAQRRKKRKEKREDGKVLPFKEKKPEGPVIVSEAMTVREFADKLGIKAKDLIQLLFKKGVMANINHVLAPETAIELAAELGVDAMEVSFEEAQQIEQEGALGEEAGTKAPRAPVVTVMGHVDHGKTSLLDRIRKAKVAEGEAGGITQHIGAYEAEVGDGRKVVFLDTPGHEAFTMMRARGSRVTDIVVLVVAADDGVMPQTVEAIDHAKAAGVPLVIAINKMDKPNANPDRVKKELSDHQLLVEDWGGDVVAVPISALKGEGIDELLEMILLTADLLELKAAPDVPGQGAVLEARKETGRGTVATVLVQNGTLRVGDPFVCGATFGKVRSMVDDIGDRIKEAGPATPVEVAGFSAVPEAGDLLQVVAEEGKAREIAEYRKEQVRRQELQPTKGKLSLDQLFDRIQEGEVKELPVVIKADVQGSVEVLKDALVKLSTEKVRVQVIHSAVGAVSTNDVLLASASEAIIIGFNVRPERNAVDLAEKEEVDIRLHTVIYEITDEIRNAMLGLLEPTFQDVTRGRVEVREIFKVPRIGTVAGCHVVEGVVPRNAQVRLLRDNVVVYTGKISSLKRFKDDVNEVRSGFDCGISLEGFQDIKPGDEIEAFVKEEVAQTL